ncbi:MAG: methyltransferase domain-containing protein [Aigarchaeota archaeon]|nr:methyltransferase domain-containing protein [Candidatus Pelearchaeum maunauluense]
MLSFWDMAYLTGLAPWDSGEPLRELVEMVKRGMIKPSKVLDIGCGTGSNVVFLASKGFETHGLDISRVALAKASKRAAAKGVKCFLHHLDFRDADKVSKLGDFDLAIDVGCYHSLPNGADRLRYINSLNKVLRKGGEYFLWCFVRGKSFSWGPPGVYENEIEQNYRERYDILESHRINTPFRDMLFTTCVR